VNIVAVWNIGYSDTDLDQEISETSMPGKWACQEVYGNLFGFGSVVVNFNRWPRFLVPVARRMLLTMVSMYFDDSTLQDLNTGKRKAQRHLKAMFRLFGAPLADAKATELNNTAD
jgi:hypothetical protein